MQQLSLFRCVHDTQPRPVTLEEVVTMMRTDQSVRDLTEKHRYARATGDEQGASRYKKMMTSFGVAALFEGGRQQKHIVELTGLSLVDIDHIPAERMGEVLALVRGDEHTLLAYTTLSGHGVRVLARYALNTSNDNDNANADAGGASVLERVERFALTTKRGLPLPRSLACEPLLGEAANSSNRMICMYISRFTLFRLYLPAHCARIRYIKTE